MSARIRGAATELAELGEEEDEFTTTTSKLRELVKGLTGFDIMLDEDTYKDIYDIVLGIGEAWDDLTDIEKASLGEALAGKRNANAFFAVIGNLETLQAAYESASDSAGSAAREQENFEKSIQYSLNRLSASFEVLATNLLDSDFAKGVVDFLTVVVDFLDAIVEHIGVLIPLVTALGGLSIIKNIDNIKGLSDLGKTLTAVGNATKAIDTLMAAGTVSTSAFAKAVGGLTIEQGANLLAEKGLTEAKIEEVLVSQGVNAQLARETAQRAVLTKTTTLQTKGTFSLRAAYKGLATSLGISTAALTAFITVAAGFAAVTLGAYEVAKANKEIAESAKEVGSEFEQSKKDIEDYKERVEELQDVIGNSESYEEVRDARVELLSIQEEMIEKYGTEAGKVIDLTNVLKDQTDAWNELTEAQWQNAKNEFNANKKWNPFDDAARMYYGASDNIDLMRKNIEQRVSTRDLIAFGAGDEELAQKIAKELGNITVFTGGTNPDIRLDVRDIYEYQEALLKIQKIAESTDGVTQTTLANLTAAANEASDVIANYGDMYDQFIYFEEILGNADYTKYFNNTKQAYEDYQKALVDGNEEAQESALRAIVSARDEFINIINDDGVIEPAEKSVLRFVDRLIPLVQNGLPAIQLEIDIETNKEDIKKDLKDALSYFDDIEHMPTKESSLWSNDKKEAWETLNEYADEYKMTIADLVDLLVKLGVVEADYNPEIPRELRGEVDAINERLAGGDNKKSNPIFAAINTIVDTVKQVAPNLEFPISYQDLKTAKEYSETLNEVYQQYNGINNMDRDFIYWDDETLKKYKDFVTEQFGSYEEGVEWLKDTWSTVLGDVAQVGEIQIAYTQLLQTEDGLLPLTEDVVWDYIDGIYAKAFDENGVFDVEKFVQLDSEGVDVLIDGQMQHIANLIAAAEGQYLNGIKLTADDVLAISIPASELPEGFDSNTSAFYGYSMHEVQEKTLLGKFNDYLKKIAGQGEETVDSQGQIIEEFFKEMEIDTSEEYQMWIDIASACDTASEAMQKYRDAVAEAASIAVDPFDYNSLSDAVSDINTKILPQFEELGELYDKIFNGDNGFDLSDVDTSDLQGLVDTFKNLDEELNITPPTEELESFMRVIGDSSSTATQVQESFNSLATAYFNAAAEAGNFSEENAVVLEQMLTEMGIVNADEVVDYYTTLAEAQKLVADNGWNLVEADQATIDSWAAEVGASEETANALYILALKQIFLNENWVNEESSIEQVLSLAKAAGIATEAVTKLANAQAQIAALKVNISNELKTGNPNTTNLLDWQTQLDNLEKSTADYARTIEKEINNATVDIDFSVPKTSSGSGSSASDAGKEAADEYVEAFEDELEKLEDALDQGVISEKEFLEKYKDLIEKYFKDVDGYAEEYAKRMHDYFDRLTSYYENVFSAIGTLLSHRIDALEKSKSAAVDAINAEKDAAAASYQAQIDYLDDLIDAKEAEIDAIDDEIDRYQDQIDAIDKQIDALEEANEKRQQAINLQKAQYELEKAQNQRTKLVYKDGQMVYENDTSAVRDAKENLEDAEFEIEKQKLEDLKKPLEEQIELLEKRKELIQDEIDSYQKQQDALQKALDASNEYYDNLIKETEAYWDALIEKLENTKSKFEELAELKTLAEAINTINSYLGDTKYTIEDVYNGTPELIEQMMQDYANALMGANSYNEDFANSLAQAAQEMGFSFDQISQDAKATESNLSPLAEAVTPLTDAATEIDSTADALEKVADNSKKVADNTSTAATNTATLSTNLSNVASNADPAAENLDAAATNIQAEGSAAGGANSNIETLAIANQHVAEQAEKVAENVGNAAEAIGEEGTNAETAYQALNNISTVNLSTIAEQTETLATAISNVASALGLTEDAPISALESAITRLGQLTLGDEGTGIIGSFNTLKTAVEGVTSAIGGGSGGSTGGGDGTTDTSPSMSAGANDGEESGGLVGAIENLHETADTHIGTGSEEGGSEEGGTVISDFNALQDAVNLVAEAIGIPGENGEVAEGSLLGVIKTMPEISEEPITAVKGFFEELCAAINSCVDAVSSLLAGIESLGGTSFSVAGGVSGGKATGNVHIGNAYANGKLGLKQSETALVGEVGRELVYNPQSGTYRTVGDRGPELTRLNKGDLVFNAKQTEAIIRNGKKDHGHSYAGGNSGIMPLSNEELSLFKQIGSAVTDMQMDVQQMLEPVKTLSQKATSNTTNIAPVINISGTSFNVSGVTGEDVSRQISSTFEGLISNAYQRAMKR